MEHAFIILKPACIIQWLVKLSKIKIIIFLIIISPADLSAQTVTTLLSGAGLNGPDGFAINNDGELHVANWGNGIGTNVLKISNEGQTSVYVEDLNAPDGLVFDSLGNLYISNFTSGIINKVTPESTKSVFASGLNYPSSIAFDKKGNLYVSNHGNGSGTTVSKISPEGTITTFASGFDAPLGLVFDSKGNLFVSNYNSGIINKVNSKGELSFFAKIPNIPLARLQYLAFDKDENLYVPSYGHNKIYMISADGEVETFAGTGTAGGKDGLAHEAEFNGPNSIAIDSLGVIYVSEYNANRIRKIFPKGLPCQLNKKQELENSATKNRVVFRPTSSEISNLLHKSPSRETAYNIVASNNLAFHANRNMEFAIIRNQNVNNKKNYILK